MDSRELIAVMERVAIALQVPMTIEETLEEITTAAIRTMPAIDHASISITGSDRTIRTLAPTDETAVRVDALQYSLGEGPCLDAVLEEPVVRADDLRADGRWPRFGPGAAELGIGSQLAFQFRAEPHVRGAVNLFADGVGVITEDDVQLGFLFANLAAAALGWSRHAETLTTALQSRAEIGQAIGIVMERYKLDRDRAFAFLVRTSQTGNIKLREVAAGIVADASSKAG
ncbi:GAF and ANTAR domain-containing protein [Kribbella sp. NPDC020789]